MATRELDGLTAFVTGSGRGLGRVMAERLAELGANVAIHDMDEQAPANYGVFAKLGDVVEPLTRHGTIRLLLARLSGYGWRLFPPAAGLPVATSGTGNHPYVARVEPKELQPA